MQGLIQKGGVTILMSDGVDFKEKVLSELQINLSE